MTILDTNVISEVSKHAASEAVLRWFNVQDPLSLFTTTISQAEMLLGVESLPAGKRRTELVKQTDAIFAEDFAGRILPFDENAARLYAMIVSHRRSLGRPISQFDAMIAAICRSHGGALATRDASGFEHCGLRLINPWAAKA